MRAGWTIGLVCGAAATVVDAGEVHAGNHYSFFLGNFAALSGGAVTVVGDDGASLWYNPAGLMVSRRDQIDLSGSAYTVRIRDYPGILRGDLPDRDDAADPKLDLAATEILSVPASLAFVRNLSDELAFGFGLFVPLLDAFSATSELEVRDPLTALDASVALSAETTVYAGAVGLGWSPHPKLRLGATLALYYQEVGLAQTLLFGYDSPAAGSPVQGNGAVVREDEISRFGFNVFLGAQWQFDREWALGLVLRTPLIQVYEGLSRRSFRLGADVAPDGTTAIVTEFAPLRQGRFDAAIYANVSGTVALAWTPSPDAFLSLELDLQPGSVDEAEVRDFTFNVRLGGIVPVSDKVRIGAGLFTDRSWVPPATDAWADRVDYYGIATGLYFETPLALAPSEADADSLVFTSTFGLRYAIGWGETLRAVADQTGIRTDPSRTPIDLVFHEIGLHVGSGLQF